MQKPRPETLRPRSHMKTFYVLDGLTSDVLLGRDLLFEIQAFIQQVGSFSHTGFVMGLSAELSLIEWLKRGNAEPGDNLSGPFQRLLTMLMACIDFPRQLAVDDQCETIRRRRAEADIALLPHGQRDAARETEQLKQMEYDHGKELRIADHDEETRRQQANSDIRRLPELQRQGAWTREHGLQVRYAQERSLMLARHENEVRQRRAQRQQVGTGVA